MILWFSLAGVAGITSVMWSVVWVQAFTLLTILVAVGFTVVFTVGVHEAGHYLAGMACGLKVRFGWHGPNPCVWPTPLVPPPKVALVFYSGGPLANFLVAAVLLAIDGQVPALLAGAHLFLGVGNLVWSQPGRDGHRILESLRTWRLLRRSDAAA